MSPGMPGGILMASSSQLGTLTRQHTVTPGVCQNIGTQAAQQAPKPPPPILLICLHSTLKRKQNARWNQLPQFCILCDYYVHVLTEGRWANHTADTSRPGSQQVPLYRKIKPTSGDGVCMCVTLCYIGVFVFFILPRCSCTSNTPSHGNNFLLLTYLITAFPIWLILCRTGFPTYWQSQTLMLLPSGSGPRAWCTFT